MLPPSVKDLVPEDDPAHFVRDLVRDELDLTAILDTYDEERGYPPYHPAMMTAVLLYAYTQGVYSSRRIARACQTRVDVGAHLERWDETTKAEFDRALLNELASLRFIEAHRHVAIVGSVGVGKTFLAHALGHIACRRGYSVAALGADEKCVLRRARADLRDEVAGDARESNGMAPV